MKSIMDVWIQLVANFLGVSCEYKLVSRDQNDIRIWNIDIIFNDFGKWYKIVFIQIK